MNKSRNFQAFTRALWNQPINKFFIVLDIIGIVSIALLVIDDLIECLAVFLFVAILIWSIFLIFAEQRERIIKLERALIDTAPDLVPMPIEISSAGQTHFILPIRNEGKSSARNIKIKMNYKDYNFSANYGSLKPDEPISLDLNNTRFAVPNSPIRIRRMMSSDEEVLLRCEFSNPFDVTFVTYWNCEWGGEWTPKTRWNSTEVKSII